MRSIKKIHAAEYSPISGLQTYRALPTKSISYLDPFLFLNHHGPQIYPPNNEGLPFGPNPHRGMETVTFILAGDIAHKDSGGHESVIGSGGVQWMTAGRGLIHAETSPENFKKKGGELEILQLWINLPASSKMTAPFYKGLQKEEIPIIILNDGKTVIKLIAGEWNGHRAAYESPNGIHLYTLDLKAGGAFSIEIPEDHNIFFYVIKGKLLANDTTVEALNLAEFNHDGKLLGISSITDSILLLGHAKPLNEPVVSQGPFVMNTSEEIKEAYNDYRLGKFGTWSF